MAGGSRVRTRTAGAHPRQAFPRHAALVLLLAALAAGCAGTRPPVTSPATSGEGVRLLYDGRSDEPSATHRFRLAIAYLPPEAVRLEIYPPVGGVRLVVIGDGARLLALDPQEKRFETLDRGLDGLVGVPLDARAFMAILSGVSPCPQEMGACTTSLWRFAAGRFEGEHGEAILTIAYKTGKQRERWPDEVRFSWPERSVGVSLQLKQGPGSGQGLETSAFRTEAPPGFQPGPVLRGLLGAP